MPAGMIYNSGLWPEKVEFLCSCFFSKCGSRQHYNVSGASPACQHWDINTSSGHPGTSSRPSSRHLWVVLLTAGNVLLLISGSSCDAPPGLANGFLSVVPPRLARHSRHFPSLSYHLISLLVNSHLALHHGEFYFQTSKNTVCCWGANNF